MFIVNAIILSQVIFNTSFCNGIQEQTQNLTFSKYKRTQSENIENFNANRIYLFDSVYYEGGVFSQDSEYLFEFNLTDSFSFVREKNVKSREWQIFYSEFRNFGEIKIADIDYKTTWKDSTFLSGKRNQIVFLQPLDNIFVSHLNEFIFNKELGIIGIIIDGTLYIRTDIEDQFKLK